MGDRNNIMICLIVLLFCSCEKQRLLNVPFGDTHYVVNGLFNTNTPCHIELSQSQYLNDTSAVNDVTNANVFLYENDRFIEKLAYNSPALGQNLGAYESSFTSFEHGQKYSINIELEGQEAITASDVIPNTDVVVSNFMGPLIADSNDVALNFELNLEQLQTEKQYFHLVAQQRWVQYAVSQSDTNLIYGAWFNIAIVPDQNPTGFIPTPSEPFSLNTGGTLQGIMLDNQHFTNLNKKISFAASNTYKPIPNLYLETRVIVRSVSENYFKYYFSSSQYYRTKSVPLTEPVIIHNNISNGLGNFSGYSSDTSATVRTYY